MDNSETKQKRHRRTKAEMKLVREIDVQPKVDDQHEIENDQPKQKRHRRTKVEMKLVREIDIHQLQDEHEIENNQSKQKRHRRTKEEMKLVHENDTPILKVEKIKHSNLNESVKLKIDYKGIPKDTILDVIETTNI